MSFEYFYKNQKFFLGYLILRENAAPWMKHLVTFDKSSGSETHQVFLHVLLYFTIEGLQLELLLLEEVEQQESPECKFPPGL